MSNRKQGRQPAASSLIVECPQCESKVEAKIIGQHVYPGSSVEAELPFRTTLVGCSICHGSIVVGQEASISGEEGDDWDAPVRLWPSADRQFSWNFPVVVRHSLEEAERCFRAKAFTACAAMCGRALEGVCRHFKTKSPYLGGGLQELLDRGVIDKPLFAWSQELQRHRNIAAHASGERIAPDDAQDLLDFVYAISEYVFVLSERFRQFMLRKEKHLDQDKGSAG
jgi:hypothetical protein